MESERIFGLTRGRRVCVPDGSGNTIDFRSQQCTVPFTPEQTVPSIVLTQAARPQDADLSTPIRDRASLVPVRGSRRPAQTVGLAMPRYSGCSK
jgi:hypothetical protein